MSPRTHELFPTANEVAANEEMLYSDHLPVMFNVPVNAEAGQYLRIISWNILGYNAPSGFHQVFRGWETEDQCRSRYQRISKSLGLFVDSHHPDMIVMQEVQSELLPDLAAMLPDYDIYDSRKGLMTLVKKPVDENSLQVLHAPVEANGERFNNIYMQAVQPGTFMLGGLRLKVNNVHTRFLNTPEHHEAFYTHLLTADVDDVISVVVGDTNSRIAPIDDVNPQNIVTGVVPMAINQMVGVDNNIQMTDFPDAAFVRNVDGSIEQVERVVLDYRTGHIFQPVMIQQEASWPQFRMILCLTDFNLDRDKIRGNTVFEYQASLKQTFAGTSVLVRKAAKDNNERGFGFCFQHKNDPLYQLLLSVGFRAASEAEPDNFQTTRFDNDVTNGQSYILFVHRNRMLVLFDMLNKIGACVQIDAQIERLHKGRFNLLLRSGKEKIQSLRQLKQSISDAPFDKSLSDIVTEWERLHVADAGLDKSNEDVISERRNRLVGTIFYSAASAPQSELKAAIDDFKLGN